MMIYLHKYAPNVTGGIVIGSINIISRRLLLWLIHLRSKIVRDYMHLKEELMTYLKQ